MRNTVPYELNNEEYTDWKKGLPVGATPTLETRNTHGFEYWKGITVQGELGEKWIPIQKPWPGQGLVSTTFPNWQPSTVAPDAIKPALLITRNDYSPVSHPRARYAFSEQLPVPAAPPNTTYPGVNHASRRASGAPYTTPYPMAYPDWPTSSQWLADQLHNPPF